MFFSVKFPQKPPFSRSLDSLIFIQARNLLYTFSESTRAKDGNRKGWSEIMAHVIPHTRASSLFNLEKAPLTNGLEQPDTEDELEQTARWCYSFGFAAIVLFYVALIGLIVYMAGDILHLYSDEMHSVSSISRDMNF